MDQDNTWYTSKNREKKRNMKTKKNLIVKPAPKKNHHLPLTPLGSLGPKKNGEVGRNINDMPEDILINIFSYLPLSDRKKTRLVCKIWNKISYDFSLIRRDVTLLHKNVSLVQTPSPYTNHVNVKFVWEHIDDKSLFIIRSSEGFWQNHCQNLRSVDFIVTGSVFWHLSKIFFFLPLLEDIKLLIIKNYSYESTLPKTFSKDVQFCNLKRLALYGNSDFIVSFLKVVLMKAPKLNSLAVEFIDTSDAIEDARTSWELDFTPSTNIKEIYFKGDRVNYFITGMADIFVPDLQRLTLSVDLENMPLTVPLDGIASKCNNLEHIELDIISGPINPPLMSFITCHSLTSISLGISLSLTDNMIASLSLLKNLAHFDLACTPGLTLEGISEAFGKTVRPSMIEFRIENVSFLSDNFDIIVEITPKLPNLKVLYLTQCFITSDSLKSLATHNRALRCLTLKGKYEKPPYYSLSQTRMAKLVHLDLYSTTIPKRIIRSLELPCLQYLFCKYKYCTPKGAGRSLNVEKKGCSYVRNNVYELYSGCRLNLTCCKSPFVNAFVQF